MQPVNAAQVQANAALGRRFFAEQDRLRGGPAPELCAAGYTAALGAYPAMNRAQHEGFAQMFYGAFSGLRHEVEHVTADVASAAVRFILHGEHSGTWFGIAPTSRTIRVVAHVVLDIEGGKVTALRGVFDEAGLLRQLGALQG
jgi:predicted ester cyclase